jgi:hypothetical protein
MEAIGLSLNVLASAQAILQYRRNLVPLSCHFSLTGIGICLEAKIVSKNKSSGQFDTRCDEFHDVLWGYAPEEAVPGRDKNTRVDVRGFNPISANLMRGPSMGEWLLSRRDRLIVARHEVPG